MSAELAYGTNDLVIGSAVQAPVTELIHYAAMDSLPTSCRATVCAAPTTQHDLSSNQCGESHGRASEDNLELDACLGAATEYVGCFSSDLALIPTINEEDRAFDVITSSVNLKEESSASAAELSLYPAVSTASKSDSFADVATAISKIATSQGTVSILGDVCVSKQHSMNAGSGPTTSQSLPCLPNVCASDDATVPTTVTTAEGPAVTESVSAVKMIVHETSTAAAVAADEAVAAAAETVFCTLSAEPLAESSGVTAVSIAVSVVPTEPSMALAAPSVPAAGAGNIRQMTCATGISGVEAVSLAATLIVEAVPATEAETTADASTSGDQWKPLSESPGCETAQLPVAALSANENFQPVSTFSFENPLYAERFIGDGTESRTADADSMPAVVALIPGTNQLHGISVSETPCGHQIIATAVEPGLTVGCSLGASAFVPHFVYDDSGNCVELEKHSHTDKVRDGNIVCPSSGDTATHITDVSATSQPPEADSNNKQPYVPAKCGPSAASQATEPTTLLAQAHGEHVDDVEDNDDDAGIYDESYRSSKWLFVGKDSDDEIDSAIAGPSKADTSQSSDPTSAAMSEDSSAIVSSARNESDRRGVYRSISCKTVVRHSSLEVFHRENTRIIEPDKTVTLTRKSTTEDFGFHIKGCHPIVVTVVKPGSLADAAGVRIGDVLLAVNYQSVLSLTHEQTLQLIAADSLTLVLELCSKLDGLVTGTVPLLIYAQPEVSSAAMVVRSGYLSKITGFLRLWKRFWFVLKPDKCLYYYRTETDKEPLGAIPLSGYMLCRATDVKKDYTVKLFSSCSTYYLAGESESDIMQWAEVLNRACASTSSGSDVWLETSAHNVSLPALALKSPDCHGQLTKLGGKMKTWRRRYCVLKDACIYYYVNISSTSAQGVAHLHGYTVDPLPSSTKKNAFNLVPPNSKMRTFYFYADTEFEKDRWVRAMTLSIGRWARLDGQGVRKRSTAMLSKSGSISEEPADRAVQETHQLNCPDDELWALVESSH